MDLAKIYSDAAMKVWPADGNNEAGLMAVYRKGIQSAKADESAAYRRGIEDAAKVVEALDRYGECAFPEDGVMQFDNGEYVYRGSAISHIRSLLGDK